MSTAGYWYKPQRDRQELLARDGTRHDYNFDLLSKPLFRSCSLMVPFSTPLCKVGPFAPTAITDPTQFLS
ncbi:hypothetical protein J6590_011669 [Homalodisca vitripennis]|nr:hypothetical protein J6590_011669 [Homalodisca vitripennis]